MRKHVQGYIEEFYQVLIRVGHAEANKEKVFHYLNRLRPNIQEELSMVRMTSIEDGIPIFLAC